MEAFDRLATATGDNDDDPSLSFTRPTLSIVIVGQHGFNLRLFPTDEWTDPNAVAARQNVDKCPKKSIIEKAEKIPVPQKMCSKI
jgi:hypothetical protein